MTLKRGVISFHKYVLAFQSTYFTLGRGYFIVREGSPSLIVVHKLNKKYVARKLLSNQFMLITHRTVVNKALEIV